MLICVENRVLPHDALMEAGEAKLKPIIMSTLSIVIGMLPMAIGIGLQEENLENLWVLSPLVDF